VVYIETKRNYWNTIPEKLTKLLTIFKHKLKILNFQVRPLSLFLYAEAQHSQQQYPTTIPSKVCCPRSHIDQRQYPAKCCPRHIDQEQYPVKCKPTTIPSKVSCPRPHIKPTTMSSKVSYPRPHINQQQQYSVPVLPEALHQTGSPHHADYMHYFLIICM
jgi:hypothetical protein